MKTLNAKVFAAAIIAAVIVPFMVLISSVANAGPKPRVMIVSAEMKGVFQTGGLGHATADLAASMNDEGYHVEVLVPKYMRMENVQMNDLGETVDVATDWYAGTSHKTAHFSLHGTVVEGVHTTLFRHDAAAYTENFFDNLRDGKYPAYGYLKPGEGFAALARAEAQYILREQPDAVVLNDWTAGLVALFLRDAEAHGAKVPKIIFAIHNMAHQGLYGGELSRWIGIDAKHWHIDGIEHNGQWSMMKAGLMYADFIYTVSPTYAKEIMTPEFGQGMDGILRMRAQQNRVTGILNGIINKEWDPSIKRPGLSHTFTSKDLSGKAAGKAELQAEMGLAVRADVPLFILTSRLDSQKGFGYLTPALENILQNEDVQIVITGDGQGDISHDLHQIAERYPSKIRVRGFSKDLEKKFTRYGDFFVNGAWFEPCGLNQFFALKNGTIPLVSNVGGLKDSVHDGVNGLKFEVGYGRESIDNAIHLMWRAVQLFHNKPAFNEMRVRAMNEDHSWAKRLKMYYDKMFAFVLDSGWEKGPLNFDEPAVQGDEKAVDAERARVEKAKTEARSAKSKKSSAQPAKSTPKKVVRTCDALFA